jgi:hypothetical protein
MQWRVQRPLTHLANALIALEYAPPRVPRKRGFVDATGAHQHDFDVHRPYKSLVKMVAGSGFDGVLAWEGRGPPPKQELELQHVHGLSGGLAPMAYTAKGDIVFSASAVAVLQDSKVHCVYVCVWFDLDVGVCL